MSSDAADSGSSGSEARIIKRPLPTRLLRTASRSVGRAGQSNGYGRISARFDLPLSGQVDALTGMAEHGDGSDKEKSGD